MADTRATTATSAIQHLTYTPDDGGCVDTAMSPFPNEAWQYGYDLLGRLTSATSLWPPSQSQSYQYDVTGNKTYDSRVGTFVYPPAGQPRPHGPAAIGGQPMQYDLNGNRVSGRGRTSVPLADLGCE